MLPEIGITLTPPFVPKLKQFSHEHDPALPIQAPIV